MRHACRPNLVTNVRAQVAVSVAVGVHPTSASRRVLSAKTSVVAASIAVWYCSTPRIEVETEAAPTTANPSRQASCSSSPTVTFPNRSVREFLNCVAVSLFNEPLAGAKGGDRDHRRSSCRRSSCHLSSCRRSWSCHRSSCRRSSYRRSSCRHPWWWYPPTCPPCWGKRRRSGLKNKHPATRRETRQRNSRGGWQRDVRFSSLVY